MTGIRSIAQRSAYFDDQSVDVGMVLLDAVDELARVVEDLGVGLLVARPPRPRGAGHHPSSAARRRLRGGACP